VTADPDSVDRGDVADHLVADAPSMLDLVRLSPRLLFPPGGRELARQIALLTNLCSDHEVLVAGCGNGVTLQYFVTEYGVHGSGVDADGHLVAEAEQRARSAGLADSMHFQTGPGDQLPYRDEVFDVTIGELGLTHEADPEEAVRELVRVTRPGGCVVLVQLVWKAPVDESRRRLLAEHLGVRPRMLVEWKRMLREAGVGRLHTEDWSDDETAFRSRVVKPFPDFAELFSLPEKLGILRRAWRRWGWRGVRTVLVREREVHELLTRERILGLDLVKGLKSEESHADPPDSATGGTDDPGASVEGLPLFTPRDENP
jgi:ubiquinone/menaquinone biosynthesis C-methylase UbiE